MLELKPGQEFEWNRILKVVGFKFQECERQPVSLTSALGYKDEKKLIKF